MNQLGKQSIVSESKEAGWEGMKFGSKKRLIIKSYSSVTDAAIDRPESVGLMTGYRSPAGRPRRVGVRLTVEAKPTCVPAIIPDEIMLQFPLLAKYKTVVGERSSTSRQV